MTAFYEKERQKKILGIAGIVKKEEFYLDNVVESTKVTEPELSIQNGGYVLTQRYSK